jgi:hypothetical protein
VLDNDGPRRDGPEEECCMYDGDDIDDHARRKRRENENLGRSTQFQALQEYDRKHGQGYVGETARYQKKGN